MTETVIKELKRQAKRLRQSLDGRGTKLSQAEALETVARQHGYRDWNTAAALHDTLPELNLAIGDRVRGRYINREFIGTVIAVALVSPGNLRQTKIQFDEPVDVSESRHFSVNRQRVSATLNLQGQSCNRKGDIDNIMRLKRLEE